PEGSTVVLTVQRAGEDAPFQVTLVRARIEIPNIETRLLEEAAGEEARLVAYISLRDFNAAAPVQFRRALQEVLALQPTGLILDLRGNPGGYLHVAVAVASEFVGQGDIVVEQRGDGQEMRYPAQPGGLAADSSLPLVVLVNAGSASASEIVAGAIQDTGRGILLGETTFGKGSVQVAHTLDDGAQLRITTARWFTPSGRAIQGQGLTPEVVVPLAEGAQSSSGDLDAQLVAALDHLTGQVE
ncbi:MAG: hypothetical protein GX605_14555, partial [Chloroflexi bacterium]|nr:hypothetical protein [Chloroflexota bacterium]